MNIKEATQNKNLPHLLFESLVKKQDKKCILAVASHWIALLVWDDPPDINLNQIFTHTNDRIQAQNQFDLLELGILQVTYQYELAK